MKLINSISFYILAIIGVLFTTNGEFNSFNIIGIFILVYLLFNMKNHSKQENYDILGITWLQAKFNNNTVIMDMTNE
jgi:hypothetical protein